MKTTVDIPEKALSELMEYTQANTKRAAIVQAVDDFNRRRRMAELTEHGGQNGEFYEARRPQEPPPRRR
jgi:hypothetical protein